jgi:hypothetical protein
MALGLPPMESYRRMGICPDKGGEFNLLTFGDEGFFGSFEWLNNHLVLLRVALASKLYQQVHGKTIESLADCLAVTPDLEKETAAAEVTLSQETGKLKLAVKTPVRTRLDEKPCLLLTLSTAN